MDIFFNLRRKALLFVVIIALTNNIAYSQEKTLSNILQSGEIHGNFQMDAQYYNEDSTIGASAVSEKMLMNGFGNVIYTNNSFSCGFRYETYLNALQGYDNRYRGNGIPYRYAKYTDDFLEVTIGSFYEQFGSGIIFRSYEEKNLGFDNALDGINLKIKPYSGIYVKGVYGLQRLFFDKGPGIIRGADVEMNFNEIFTFLEESKTKIIVGGSGVSKYQKDEDPTLKLPENVAAMSGRIQLSLGNIQLSSEYAYKINDPSALNNYIYKPGEALIANATYSKKGMSITISGKRIDNMSFHSDRAVRGNELAINFIPPTTVQHHYSLPSLFPYATQENGEFGGMMNVRYTFKKNTILGGKYGTQIAINYARAQSIDKTAINDSTPLFQRATLGYKSDFFKFGKEVYYEDAHVELAKKLNPKFKFIATFVNLIFPAAVIEGHPGQPIMYGKLGILDLNYKLNDNHAIRTELQHLYTRQEQGNHSAAMVEYTIHPHWFFALADLYEVKENDIDKSIHYYNFSLGYLKNSARISLTYGKQRAGIVCVGGVCRSVPASNGLLLSVSTSF